MTSEQLKATRAEFGLSQPKFADKLLVSVRTVRAWEQGQNDIPGSIELLIQLLKEKEF